VQGQAEAGAVNIIYGTSRGLTSGGDEQFTKALQDIAGVPQPRAHFGAALAAGDIDGDGYADLAIGAPDEDVGALEDQPQSGSVTVLYGSAGGLRTRQSVGNWSQNSIGISGNAQAGDQFGFAVAIGDFDGDGRGDLAVGVPGDTVGGNPDAGAVNVLYGRARGLTADGQQLWTQNTSGIKGMAGSGHRFGLALAAADMSRNGRDDLAIGIPGGVISGHDRAGAVSVLYGRRGGLSSADNLWSQDARGIDGIAEPRDMLGSALAIGDFDTDGAGDLAIGVPADSVGNSPGAGVVNVIYGSIHGLREDPDELWTQDSRGIKSRASIGETFGSALAAADLSRNGADDLVIGVPGQQIGGDADAGAVNVLYGNGGRGLDDRGDQFWHQNSRGIEGRAEPSDGFGDAVAVGDFDGDGSFDLAVGTPRDSVGPFADGGAVNVIHGSLHGLREDPDRLWTQGAGGINGAVGNDQFGAALATGFSD
jgi:hypothetical protein